MSRRKLRVGMVGGGGAANFFGAPHRRGILMDNSVELTAGSRRTARGPRTLLGKAVRKEFAPLFYGESLTAWLATWRGMSQ